MDHHRYLDLRSPLADSLPEFYLNRPSVIPLPVSMETDHNLLPSQHSHIKEYSSYPFKSVPAKVAEETKVDKKDDHLISIGRVEGYLRDIQSDEFIKSQINYIQQKNIIKI